MLTLKEKRNLQGAIIFTKTEPKDKEENSRKLFRLFGKVIQSLAELNFKEKTLHGDIRPETIEVKLDQKGMDDFELAPVITEFGLRLTNATIKKFITPILTYTQDYRPPEMTQAAIAKFMGTEIFDWDLSWRKYKFSPEFVEDVYALGKTIGNVINLQRKYVDDLQCETKALITISNEATKIRDEIDSSNDGATVKVRPNMKEILNLFLEKMKECDPNLTLTLNQQLYSEIKSSLDSMKSNNLLI